MILGVLAAAQAAVSIGSAIMDHKAQDKAHDANRTAAQRALRLKRQDISIRGIEERDAAGDRIQEAYRQAAERSSMARVSAIEAGVGGQSAEDVLGDITGDASRYATSVRRNLVVTLDQLQRIREGAAAEAESRINSVPRASLAATALRVFGGVTDAATFYRGGKP